jgi:hypothetical protein
MGHVRDVGGANGVWPVEKYNALFDRFNPSNYDPDPWLAAAAKAVSSTRFSLRATTTATHFGRASSASTRRARRWAGAT